LHGVRQQRKEARALDRLRQLALVLGRDRSDARRHDLAAFADVALQQAGVLVVDRRGVVAPERIDLPAAEKRFGRHGVVPFLAVAAGGAVTVAAITAVATVLAARFPAVAAITTVTAIATVAVIAALHLHRGAVLVLVDAD